ncbi:MAG: hypothetical protein IPM57_11935 [Oligoflexia bacterium]|nr:hypothetical protein [Oligoflexia bacterium]
MKKHSFLFLLPLVLVAACKKEIFGRLDVAKEFIVNNRVEKGGWFSDDKYELQPVPAGNWKASLKFEDDVNVWLLIEDGFSKKVSPFKLTQELKDAFQSETANGVYNLNSKDSGQPLDVKIDIKTNVTYSERRWDRETCQEYVPYQVQVCNTNPNGQTTCHWETRYHYVQGDREVEYYLKWVDKSIATEFFVATREEAVARMPLQDREQFKITTYRGPCRLGYYPPYPTYPRQNY